ncbi:UPF0481 protein At3g47200-like [Neltuma alba]|uniref:UPF0481 protein At3g47200-like n=1 Tax=Neltuma alba TaxID=207710 RepID=UPI0010A42AA2|nr:UPF0481 protein At3g47200-like [Prosopis alba]
MIDLDTLADLAKQSEPMVRASYLESINYSKKDFVKLILVDSAFIIQLFTMKHRGHMKHDAKLSQSWLEDDVDNDLLLLQNQRPFFFLEELYNIAFPCNHRGNLPSFLELTYPFFDYLNMQRLESNHKKEHFTDPLRLFYLSRTHPIRDRFKGDGPDRLMYGANEL